MKVDKTIFWLFFIGMLCPTTLSFSLGSLRLTIYRSVLLIFMVTALPWLFKTCRPSLRNPSFMMLAYAIWAGLAVIVNHGLFESIETGGIYFVELLGPYLITLAFCNSVRRIALVVKIYLTVAACMLIITLPETITGLNWTHALQGINPGAGVGTRLGLHRAFGTFDHPILLGVFASSAVGLAWFASNIRFFAGVLVAALTSVSSGALVSIFIQLMIIGWERFTKRMPRRWLKLLALLIAGYIAADLISNRSGMRAILTSITLSPHTAYWRMLIWEHGFANALANPIFGIGFNDWVRPWWMYSSSIDAFWLVSMVRYGLPAFVLYAGAFLTVIYNLYRMKLPTRELTLLRRGWLCGMMGLAVSSCTVHLWNNSFIFINFYLGLGAAMSVVFARELRKAKRQQDDAGQPEPPPANSIIKP